MHHKKTSKKNLIAILGFALFIAAFFTTRQNLTSEMSHISSVMVIVFALPTYYAVIKSKGLAQGLVVLLALGIYALSIETSALATGFPYGDFKYTGVLGAKIFDITPWTVAFAYPPVLILAHWYARKKSKNNFGIIAYTAVFATLIDMVLDPAAVRLGFWAWNDPGFYYGVPLVNFLGWLLTGAVGALLIQTMWGDRPMPKTLAYSGIGILWFWTAVNICLGHIIPSVIGLMLCATIFYQLSVKDSRL